MQKASALEKTREFVQNNTKNDPSHDWWHVYRVWKFSKFIGEQENADMFVVEMASLLHDLEDWKFHGEGTKEKTLELLEQLDIDRKDISNIIQAIEDVTFKGAGEKEKKISLETKVVQDADRLDALGAIGIARVFAFAGWKNNPLYDPGIKISNNMTFDTYRKASSPAINHFYEKLLLLKDRMNTKTGRAMAENRHKFMENYLEQFFKEWDGKE